ncbi:MAG: pseudouridine synthase [Thiomargarita sp.]|nr:pseudouridine synthase [Thiomargarita sp.]
MPIQNTEKLQKVLARAGLGSRREIELWIKQQRIQINGQIAIIGDRVKMTDHIHVDGKRIFLSSPPDSARQILCYHKSIGELCTRHDPEGRSTVFENLPPVKKGRWISIGRLDLNTAGLLLFTTDGDLAHRLMHPSYTIEREYAVRVFGIVDEDILKNLSKGVELDDGMARFSRIINIGGRGTNHWYHVTIQEGRKHEVRRLWESQDLTVSRLIRIRFGPILLPPNLRRSRYINLDTRSSEKLLKLVNL